MKSRTMTIASACLVISMLAFAGCAKPPEMEIQTARDALQKAQQAEAASYAAQPLQAAEAAQTALNEELQAQEQKFALFRSYDKARTLATEAQTAAQTAADEAAAGKARARQEAETMMTEVTTMLNETMTMLAAAPVGKGTTMDLQVMRSDLDGASAALSDAKTLFDQEKYNDARNRIMSARSTVESVKASVEQARQMKAGKKAS